MINNKSVLAVIPARGGSKRCKRKNVLDFRGKPLIYWSIEAARGCPYIDKVVVSTEDSEIHSLAKSMGCAVIKRPEELATDEATNEDVLRHALSVIPHDRVVLLQPTSPLRNSDDIEYSILKSVGQQSPCITYSLGTKRKNGAVYTCEADWLTSGTGRDFDMYYCEPFFMPEARSLDIDYEEDFNG